MQKIRGTHLFQHVRAVIARGPVDGEADRNPGFQHFRDSGDSGGKLHIGDGAMSHAGTGLGQKLHLIVIKMNPMRIPHIIPDPSDLFHVSQRTNAFFFEHIPLFILCLRQMSVQAHPKRPCQFCALNQQFPGYTEGRTGRKRDPVHRIRRGIVVFPDGFFRIPQYFIDSLDHTVRREAAVLFA